jgi:dephospho-CoA kinase
MKVLVFGPSGAGKTYVSQMLKKQGINAFDDGDIKDLSGWYNQQGQKVASPATAHEALNNRYSFLWSRQVLKRFLDQFTEVYVFGGSGNIFSMLDLFDKTYFLKVEPHIQKERILHSSRATPQMDFDENGIVTWGDWLEQEAQKRAIPFIDATLLPGQILEIISKP